MKIYSCRSLESGRESIQARFILTENLALKSACQYPYWQTLMTMFVENLNVYSCRCSDT